MRASISFVQLSRRAAILTLLMFAATVTFSQVTPSDDAYVNSAAPTTNYGAASTLNLSSAGDTGFIRFDLTAVPASYTGSLVAKATLKLYVNTVTTAGSFNVDYVTGTWAEKTIKYSTQPSIGTTIAAGVPLTTASKGTYVQIDITPAVVEWLNGTQANDGIALVANSPLVATFDSKENTATSHAPEIDIVYAPVSGIQIVTTSCNLTFTSTNSEGNCGVSCPSGTVLLGGGGGNSGGDTLILIGSSQPMNAVGPANNGWWVDWHTPSNGTGTVTVTTYAICAP